MSNEQEKVIYSMHRVTKRHGQKEVLKDIIDSNLKLEEHDFILKIANNSKDVGNTSS